MRRLPTVLALACISPLAAGLGAPEPSDAARKVAEEIRTEALLPLDGPEGRPLPLAGHWNMGQFPGSFEPGHQIELLQQGHRILPWMSEPIGDPDDEDFQTYYKPLMSYIAELDLPFSMRGTQWEAMRWLQTEYATPLSRLFPNAIRLIGLVYGVITLRLLDLFNWKKPGILVTRPGTDGRLAAPFA